MEQHSAGDGQPSGGGGLKGRALQQANRAADTVIEKVAGDGKLGDAVKSTKNIGIAGATGGWAGAGIQTAKELNKSKGGRGVLIGLTVLALSPLLSMMLLIGAVGALLNGSMSQSNATEQRNQYTTQSAQGVGFQDDSHTSAYKDAAAGFSVPWYVLAAIAGPAPDLTNVYTLNEGATDVSGGSIRDARGDAQIILRFLQDEVPHHAGQWTLRDWQMITGMMPQHDGSAMTPIADEAELKELMRTAWVEAVKKAPIKDAETRAEQIVDQAIRIATGAGFGCFSPGAGMTNPTGVLPPNGTWSNPLVGNYTSKYGMRLHPVTYQYKLHDGIDIAAPAGTAIHAAGNGVVDAVGALPSPRSCGVSACGQSIQIDHGDGVKTRYEHMSLSTHKVKLGDQVFAGQHIADVGNEGYSTGPHLHFGVVFGDSTVDPDAFLAERGVHVARDQPVSAQPSTGGSAAASLTGDTGVPISNPASIQAQAMTVTQATGVVVQIPQKGVENAFQAVGFINNPANWPEMTPQMRHKAAVIAVAVMAQESFFGLAPGIETPNGDNDAGFFQQRVTPGWYGPSLNEQENIAAVNNVLYGTKVFIEGRVVQENVPGAAGPVGYRIPGLTTTSNWFELDPILAAHRVQRSAYPEKVAKWLPVGEQIVAAAQGLVVSGDFGVNTLGCNADGLASGVGGVAGGGAALGVKPASGKLISPVPPEATFVYSSAGYPRYPSGSAHYGWDLASNGKDWMVLSICDGTVREIKINPKYPDQNTRVGGTRLPDGWSNYLWVDCGNDVWMGYAHFEASKLNSSLQVGTKIGAGTALFPVGNQGNSSGKHLHLQISTQGTTRYSLETTVNPQVYLAQFGVQLPPRR